MDEEIGYQVALTTLPTALQQRFVDELLKGGTAADAARRAGYATARAPATACRLLKKPKVIAAVAAGRRELSKRNELSLDAMVRQFQSDHEFAIETKNATAAVRATELVARLGGHLIDRRDVRMSVAGFHVNISGIDVPVQGEVVEGELAAA